jgi:hypothetical protein
VHYVSVTNLFSDRIATVSALGQKLPRRGQNAMSALPPKAAAALADRRVR